jgi:hypothetical protein
LLARKKKFVKDDMDKMHQEENRPNDL